MVKGGLIKQNKAEAALVPPLPHPVHACNSRSRRLERDGVEWGGMGSHRWTGDQGGLFSMMPDGDPQENKHPDF